MAELELRNLSKLYGQFRAVDDFSLAVARGEFVTILGASGSGKTTTLMMIAGFTYPTFGEILFRDRAITYMPPHLRNMGMVFQGYALFPHLSVRENIAYPLKLRRVGRAEIARRVDAALDLVRLAEQAGKRPAALSGGQQQRVALARALVFGPSLLLMDEPLGALDKALRDQMQREIKRVQAATGVTIVSVTHDQDEALAMSDRIVLMERGRVEVIDTPQGLYERPPSALAAAFMKEVNLLPGSVTARTGAQACILVAGGLELRTPMPAAACIGGDVVCCLRPEHIALHSTPCAPPALPARIREKIYLGDIVKLQIVLDGSGVAMTVKALAAGATRHLAVGDGVFASWEDSDVQLLAA